MKTNAILEKVNQQQAEIEKHGKLDPEILKKINYKFRLDWNYYSNRMEGGTLTQAETRSVMVGNIDVKGKPFKDVIEMNGHDRTVLDILKLGKGEQRLSEKRIKEIHHAIMHEDDPEKRKEIGEWKTTANEIINYKGEKIDFTPPSEVADQVHEVLNKTNADLDALFNSKKQSKHPLEIASQFHIDFVTIHPFYDGNGRTTRILMNVILVSCGYPPIIIKENQKNSYYQLLADIQVYGGKANLFQDFIGERLIESQQIVLDAIAGKSIEEEDDINKEISIFKKQVLSEQMTGSIKKTNEIVKEYYNNYFKKIFEVFVEKHLLFDELFSENIYRKSVDNGHPTEYYDDYQEKQIQLITSNKPPAKYINQTISHLAVRVDHKGYKNKGLNMFDMHQGIQIKLDDYQFFIACYGKKEARFTYNDFLSDEFISKYVNDVIKTFLEDLKVKTLNPQN